VKRAIVVSIAIALFAVLVHALWQAPPAAVDLRGVVTMNLAASGVDHPVTAVLLNFRGYDTLLEVAVLLVALIAILAAGITPRDAVPPAGDTLLRALAGLVVPVMLVVAIYLLWAGAFRPGGAFQAAATLAAAAVLMHLTGRLPAWPPPGPALRWGMLAGFLVFLAIAVMSMAEGSLLQYPRGQAGALILLIEAGLTFSLSLILGGLFLLLSRDRREIR
jgi:multisubunit Na+/H+ antiporter MnhB subunit